MPISRFPLLRMLMILVLVACARPPDLIGIDNPSSPALSTADTRRHEIFITTTRRASDAKGQFFSGKREARLALASVTVTIPPNHVPGDIERPTTLPPNPQIQFAVVEPALYPKDQAFIASINRALAKRAPQDRNVLLFVHGYNTTLSDGVLRLAQFVEDTGFRGVPVLFSWASAGRRTDYVYDLNSALAARPFLEQASGVLVQTKARGFDLFAHSMGTLLTMEVIVQSDLQGTFGESGRLRNVMLAAPDIDLDLFKSQLSQLRNRPGNLFVFVSADDEALAVSRAISGGVDRVGDTTPAELAGLPVTVIDLSAIADSTSGTHSKYAASPAVVQLIGSSLQRNNFDSTPGPPSLVEVLDGVPILRDIIN